MIQKSSCHRKTRGFCRGNGGDEETRRQSARYLSPTPERETRETKKRKGSRKRGGRSPRRRTTTKGGAVFGFFWGEFETVKMHILKLYILYVWFVFTQVYLYKYTYSVQLAIEFQKLPMFEVIATLRTQLCSLEQSDWLHPLFQWDGLGVMNVRWFMVQND